MVELLPEHPGVKRGVRQRADAEDNVRGVTVRIDKIVGEGQFNGETRVTRQKPRQARRDVPLSEKKTGPLIRSVPDGSRARSSSSRRASSIFPAIARA